MACNQKQEWNELLEDCKQKAKVMKEKRKKLEAEQEEKRKQDEIKKYEAESQRLYSEIRTEIDSNDKLIKEHITGWMSDDRNSLTYYKPEKYHWYGSSYAMHKSYLPEKYVKKVFKTTTYGDKILLELLREKFPKPFKITLCDRKIKIDWVNR